MIVTTSNIDFLITPLQLHYGDIEGTAYSEAVYRTSLLSAVSMLSNRWNGKYYVDADNNVQRNTDITFDNDSPPLVEYQDQYALVLAATVILRQASLTSSSASFTNWQTPDISVSAGSKERSLTKLYDNALAELNGYFSKGLGKSRKSMLWTTELTWPIPPYLTGSDIPPT